MKKDLYDLKLRIYYMEQREKILNGEDGDDIYQKYMDLQVSCFLLMFDNLITYVYL